MTLRDKRRSQFNKRESDIKNYSHLERRRKYAKRAQKARLSTPEWRRLIGDGPDLTGNTHDMAQFVPLLFLRHMLTVDVAESAFGADGQLLQRDI